TWRKILERGGRREQSMARLAEVYAEHNLNGESLELYQKAARLAPDDEAIERGLAGALERMHRDAEAEAIWQRLYDGAIGKKKRAEALEVRQRLLSIVARQGRLLTLLRSWRRLFDAARDDASVSGYGLLAADAALKLGHVEEADLILRSLVK